MRKLTLRFWLYVHGWVKVSLTEGQSLSWAQGGQTDEGWSSNGLSLYYSPNGFVRLTEWSDGRDCDGRLSNERTMVCDAAAIRATGTTRWNADVTENHRDPELRQWMDAPIFRPPLVTWEEETPYRQRDYAAEAAGY